MANRTDPAARSVHGSNPQFLISRIVRNKVYLSMYWKQSCFGLTADSLVDKAVNLQYVGGTYGGSRKASPFLCLVLKLLQIQPDDKIIYEYINNGDFKYLTALGAFYLRMTGQPRDIYTYLEPLFMDYRKLRIRYSDGKIGITHMDEFIDDIFTKSNVFDIDLPVLPKRHILEDASILRSPRKSGLEFDIVFKDGSDDGKRKPAEERGKISSAFEKCGRIDSLVYSDTGEGSDSSVQKKKRDKNKDSSGKKSNKSKPKEKSKARKREKNARKRERSEDSDYESHQELTDQSEDVLKESHDSKDKRRCRDIRNRGQSRYPSPVLRPSNLNKYRSSGRISDNASDSEKHGTKRSKKSKKNNQKRSEAKIKDKAHKHENYDVAVDTNDGSSKHDSTMSVNEWNKLREQLKMAPLK